MVDDQGHHGQAAQQVDPNVASRGDGHRDGRLNARPPRLRNSCAHSYRHGPAVGRYAGDEGLMATALSMAAAAFWLTLALGYPALAYLRRAGVTKQVGPDELESHFSKTGTPTMGGLL